MPFLVRFFRAVPPWPALMPVTFSVVAGAGLLAVLTDPRRAVPALGPLLLLQMFAAASGFAAPARRGHYDLLLARGERRTRLALAHWVASGLPGVLGWAAIAAAEAAALGRPGAGLTTGTLAALWLVSTVPWALTVPLPRFAGAIGWLLLVGVLETVVPRAGWPAPVEATLLPAVLLGRPLAGPDLPIVLPGLVLGLVAIGAACLWIARMTVPLEAGQ